MGRRFLPGVGTAGVFPAGPAMFDVVVRVLDTLVCFGYGGRG